MVTRDRDTLQTDQIQWGLDRERLLVDSLEHENGARTAALEQNLGERGQVPREQHQGGETRSRGC